MTVMISPIPAFADNYIWLLQRGSDAAVVDPGDPAPVRALLGERSLRLTAILITHHHMDHTGGLEELKAEFGVPVYGPRAEAKTIPGLTQTLQHGDRIAVPGIELEFDILSTPGHTLGQIAFVNRERRLLFCGDTLFSAGCGRLFEGTPAQMHDSLSRLSALPEDTAVYCAHEYTLANLAFAAAVEPDNADIQADVRRVRELRARAEPSLPSSIGHEQHVNPFLRCGVPNVRRAAEHRAGRRLDQPVEIFAVLRGWKDQFRPPAP